MRTRSTTRLIAAIVCGAAFVLAVLPSAAAQTRGKESYTAVTVNMGTAPTVPGRVLITIDRWSTAIERSNLLKVLAEKGPDKLLDALKDNPKVGFIRLPNTLAWDLRYAFETPLPDGGRKVVLATDRPIGTREAINQPRTVDYPFTLLEIRFGKDGVGEGKMSVYTKIGFNKDTQTLELENYGSEATRLTEVRIEK